MAELAFQEDLRPLCWLKVLIRHGSQASAALGVFSKHIRPGDNAPELLRRLAADLPAGSAEAVPRPSRPHPCCGPAAGGTERAGHPPEGLIRDSVDSRRFARGGDDQDNDP